MAEIAVYTIIVLVSYFVLKNQYSKRRYYSRLKTVNLSWTMIVFTSFLWVIFNIVITNLDGFSGDRLNYVENFNGRTTPSLGLSWIISFIHSIHGDVKLFFYITTFICMFITMYAYRINSYADPSVILLLYFTQYAFLTTSLLKQTYTSAFAVLFFTYLLQDKRYRTNVKAIVLIALACLFHPSGFILIPMYLIIKVQKNWKTVLLYIFALVAVSLFFQPILLQIAAFIRPLIPSLSTKIMQYFGRTIDLSEGSASVLKGFPIYLISVLGVYKRRSLKNVIDNYDNQLIVTLTGSFIYLMSIYSTWIYRFVYLFYFSIFVFYSQIMKNISNKRNALFLNSIVYVSLALIQYRFLYLVYVVRL